MSNQNERLPLRFAVVGCGQLARKQHIRNIAESKRAALQVCCDLDDAALALCNEQFRPERTTKDFHEAINADDVDALVLATTEKLRLAPIEAAAKAGKPVYVEKPLAQSLAEAMRIQAVVTEAGIPFCVGHNRRSAPAMLEAHRIFREHMTAPKPCPWRFDREGPERPRFDDDGVAGINVRINDDWYSWKKWVFDKTQAPHGPMLFEMTHFTDVCNWFLDAQPAEVVALEHKHFNHGVVIRFETGEMATINMMANGTHDYPKELYEATGNGGIVCIDTMLEMRTAGIVDAPAVRTYPLKNDPHPEVGQEGGLYGWLAKTRAACEQAAKTGDTAHSVSVEADKGHAHALERFIDEILGQGEMVCGVDDAVLATEVALAAVQAAHEKRAITLDEVRDAAKSGA